MKKPLVSLITLNYNRKDLVQKTINCFLSQTYSNTETIVVDAQSTDGSFPVLKRKYPQVTLIELSRNMGVAGMNEGMQVAKGEYFILVDSDAVIGEGAVEKVVERFEQNPTLGLVAFKLIDVDTNEIMSNPGHSHDGDLVKGYKTAYFNGAAFGFRRDAFKKIGGFSEKYFLYINEMRLAAKLANIGYEIRYFPDLVVWHKMAPNPTRQTTGKILMARNTIWYIVSFIPALFIFKIIWWLLFGFTKGSAEKHAKPGEYIKGLLLGIIGLPGVISERDPVSKSYAEEILKTTLLTDGYTDEW